MVYYLGYGVYAEVIEVLGKFICVRVLITCAPVVRVLRVHTGLYVYYVCTCVLRVHLWVPWGPCTLGCTCITCAPVGPLGGSVHTGLYVYYDVKLQHFDVKVTFCC